MAACAQSAPHDGGDFVKPSGSVSAPRL